MLETSPCARRSQKPLTVSTSDMLMWVTTKRKRKRRTDTQKKGGSEVLIKEARPAR